MRLTSFLALSSLAILGCRSDSNNNSDGNSGGDGSNGSGGAVTIQQVQNDAMAPGTPVTLHGVVVTAIDAFGTKTGDIWVEEPEGGAFSGVHVFGAPSTSVAMLTVGDIVDVSGAVKDEFALTGSGGDMTGRTITELKAASAGSLTVTKTGTGTVPAPQVVDALTIGQMADADTQGPMFSAEWEKWEGVLITVNNVSALGAPKCIGSACTDPTAQSVGITGVAKLESTLAAFPTGIARGDCLGSVTGVVDYFFDYLILPRNTADVATGGTGCPVAEATCGDSVDNDGNGFADCKDNNCIINDGTCHMSSTIAALDAAADANPAAPTLPAGGLSITGACVTAIPTATTPSSVYIAAAGVAANDGGLFVFGGGQPLPAGLMQGDLVDVVGTASAFKSNGSTAPEAQLELNGLQVTKKTGACVPTAKPFANVDISTLEQDATGHPLIGSLVTLNATGSAHNFKITTANTATNKFGVLTQNVTTVKFGVTMLPSGTVLGTANTTCFDTITGIWTYDTAGAGGYEILPTSQPATATCK